MATYTVVKGDCLYTIAKKQLGSANKWPQLATLNGISSPYTIYPGQVLNLDIESSTEASTTPEATSTSTSNMPTVTFFGLVAGTDRQMLAAWAWSKSNTANYRVMWYDYISGMWVVGNDSTTTDGTDDYKNSMYTASDNAAQVKFKVMAISETYTSNDVETSYWTGSWSTVKTYDFSNNPPQTPDVPTVEIDGYTLKAYIENINATELNATKIQFQVYKDNTTKFNTGTATINTDATYVSYSCTVDAGGEYKVRARSTRDSTTYSDWSDFSSAVGTKPAASSGITSIKGVSETEVYLAWSAVSNATSYEIEYTTNVNYFDASSEVTSITGIENTFYYLTGLESGDEYFFRIRAVNDSGESAWTSIKSVVIGTTPSAPTTWSSTTTGMVGDSITLFWVHNCEDGSAQQYAQIDIYVDGNEKIYTLNTVNEDDDEKTSYWELDTSLYTEGTTVEWRVRTAGVTNEYGEWSVQRTINIYAPPTLELHVTDASGRDIDILEHFPLYISAIAGPSTQAPISYHLAISAESSYETVDNVGNTKIVTAGEEVYSNNFDISENLLVTLSAGNLDLENNVTYTVTCTVSMNSGLTTTASEQFTVAWTDELYSPDASIAYDSETLAVYIRPYCMDENNEIITNVTLSVYRREFDGSFVELATGIVNGSNTFITDPHPALDYARYRIVAIATSTGAVSFYDAPGYPVGEKSVIIQWNEEWTNFDPIGEEALEEPAWTGSMLKLPYNVDVSDTYDPDTSLVEYIGREYPVSYYGTQIGQTASWSVEVDKTDKETLYALRRLAIWMGDCYVREPSGSGYWASIKVSFSQTHCELTIPVSMEITRVVGGV